MGLRILISSLAAYWVVSKSYFYCRFFFLTTWFNKFSTLPFIWDPLPLGITTDNAGYVFGVRKTLFEYCSACCGQAEGITHQHNCAALLQITLARDPALNKQCTSSIIWSFILIILKHPELFAPLTYFYITLALFLYSRMGCSGTPEWNWTLEKLYYMQKYYMNSQGCNVHPSIFLCQELWILVTLVLPGNWISFLSVSSHSVIQ